MDTQFIRYNKGLNIANSSGASGPLASLAKGNAYSGLKMQTFGNTAPQTSKSSASDGFNWNALANQGVTLASSLINPSGNTTGVGSALQTVGSLTSTIPGVGGLIGTGVNAVGGLWNATFGSNLNKDFINQTKSNITDQSNYYSDATTNESLLNDWSNHSDLSHVKKSQVGSDGWFSNKAKKTTRNLNSDIDNANLRAWNSLNNTAGNVDTNNDLNLLANYAALGGPLSNNQYYSTMEKVAAKNYKKWGLSSVDEGLMNALNDNGYNYRGYYDKYPESAANADSHWSDEFKTVYHPTFSDESIYNGKKSIFNPDGLKGGHWNNETFIPAEWQSNKKALGGPSKENNGHIYGEYSDLNGEMGYLAEMPEVVITGNKNRYIADKWNKEHSHEYSERYPRMTVDSKGNLKNTYAYNPSAGFVSGTDPLGQLYVEGIAMSPLFKGAGKLMEYGLAKAGSKVAKSRIVGRELSKYADDFDNTVGESYFNSPNNWYRITETPEVHGIKEVGKNVTTRDMGIVADVPSNNWRESLLKLDVKKVDGGWALNKNGRGTFLRKSGSAHGNTSQASKGIPWQGSTSGSDLFPNVIIEGEAKNDIFSAFNPKTQTRLGRSNFVLQPWDGVPIGERIGFHSGEMPMDNLKAFTKLKNGRYSYEPIIPDKRIELNGETQFRYGGNMNGNGTNFTDGVIQINNGGTHEQNPNGGVPMGVDDNNTPNLVEEGEVKFNNYIFSNRLMMNKATLKNMRAPERYAGKTYAEVAEKFHNEAKERPNDPISKRGLMSNMTKLQIAQEEQKSNEEQKNMEKNTFASGGYPKRPSNTSISYTTDWNKYIGNKEVSDYLKLSASNGEFPYVELNKDLNNINNNYGRTLLGNATPHLTQKYPVRNASWEILDALGTDNLQKGISQEKINIPQVSLNNNKPTSVITPSATIPSKTKTNKDSGLTALRYAPVLGAGISAFTDAMGWTNKPDYSNIDSIEAAMNQQAAPDIQAKPIGNYMAYNPFDTDYYGNKLEGIAGSTRRAIQNNSGGNRMNAMAGILASDYNTMGKMGDLARQAEEYNLNQKSKIEEFNRGTNQFNSQMALQADSANQKNRQFNQEYRLKGASTIAQMREAIRQQADNNKSANLTNFFNSLGDIGKEEFTKNMINSNEALYYSTGRDGTSSYKKKAKGGYLTGKGRR